MRFVSLSNPTDNVSLQEAIERGVPQDSNSLYVPEYIPQLSDEAVHSLVGADPIQIGKIMLSPYTSDEMTDAELDRIVCEAVTFDTPLVEVGDRKVLELDHGPTFAFKDVAARYLASIMSHYNRKSSRHSTIVVVSTGDTAKAMAEAVADMEGIDVVTIYPKDGVSEFQQVGLRRVAENVHPIELDGTFNDGLKLADAAFADPELRERLGLTTANSISIGRLLPQTTYYAGLHGKIENDGRIAVPVGNQGNLTAGLLTRAMGVPLPNFIGANNANGALFRHFQRGYFEPTEHVATLSNAMDVTDPKNSRRIEWLFGGDINLMRSVIEAAMVSDEQTAETIMRVHEETGYVLDPHTAVAWAASQSGDTIISTASKVKFASEIYRATGIEVDDSVELAQLRRRPERHVEIANDYNEFKGVLDGLPV
jgi:threonine synthase